LVDRCGEFIYNPEALRFKPEPRLAAWFRMSQPSGKIVIWTPLKIVGLQVIASLTCAGLWWGIRGHDAAIAAIFGGAVCFVPGAWFALRLARAGSAQDAYVFAFFLGEGIKVLLSVLMFVLVAVLLPDADWLALLTTYIAVLQVYLFGLYLTAR